MPLETATHINDLVVTNPANSDGLNQADDHMRMIKQVLLTDIGPSMTDKKLTAINGSASVPSISFASEPTLGIYRLAAGIMAVAGGKLKGVLPVGGLHQFLIEPVGLGKGAVGTGHDYLELDGSTWPNSAFPDLATHLGQGGTTFTLPNAYATGRFLRSRTASVAAGTAQANQNKTHTHPVVGTSGAADRSLDHLHTGATGSMNRSNPHSHTVSGGTLGGTVNVGLQGGGTYGGPAGSSAVVVNAVDINHEHAFTTNGADRSIDHLHGINFTSGGGSADGTEARPEALSVVLCIKT
jgi:hypothetical protein